MMLQTKSTNVCTDNNAFGEYFYFYQSEIIWALLYIQRKFIQKIKSPNIHKKIDGKTILF